MTTTVGSTSIDPKEQSNNGVDWPARLSRVCFSLNESFCPHGKVSGACPFMVWRICMIVAGVVPYFDLTRVIVGLCVLFHRHLVLSVQRLSGIWFRFGMARLVRSMTSWMLTHSPPQNRHSAFLSN